MIEQLFKNKKTRRFVSCKSKCELSFNQRWVYSYLVFHARRPSVNAIAKALGMKHKTVKAAVAELVQHGLAATSGREVRACEPAQDWFARWNKRGGAWRDCLGYSRVRVMGRSCPLTLAQNTLYWVLVSLARRETLLARQSCAGLASALGVSRKTVQRALAELRFWQLILVRQKEKFFDVQFLEPDSDVVSWYEDKPAAKKDAGEEPAHTRGWKTADVKIEEVEGPLEQVEDSLPQYCIDYVNNSLPTLTENQRRIVAVWLKNGCIEMHELDDLDESARAEHCRNQRAGKTKNSGHHGKLLWYKVLRRLEKKGYPVAKYDRLA